ncbi:MAG: amidoligase family protein [Akkermansiaceae bacterium]|nr:amidoligase family protein [Akkermansiaceae bacterium]
MSASDSHERNSGQPDRPCYRMPGRLSGLDGSPRRIGVEIEMSGVELPVIAAQLVAHYGGTIDRISDYEFRVEGTVLGDFKVDLDFEYLQKLHRDDSGEGGDWMREFEHLAADTIQALMRNLIPCEVISPPLPFARLGELDWIVDALRSRGANGSRQALFAAFGLHLNLELPDLEAGTILTYLRAFVCLQAWLEDREDIVYSRKFSPFIRSYAGAYEDLILAENYSPSLGQLIDDYLEHNPSRNRILDMLPMFAFLDESKVVESLPKEKIRKRPTLHYRLPNSDIDNPAWGIWRSWNDWQEVESLAEDPHRLRVVCEAYRRSRAGGYFSSEYHSWKEDVKQWLNVPS